MSLLNLVDSDIKKKLEEKLEAAIQGLPVESVQYRIKNFVSENKGKMLRPLLVAMTCKILSHDEEESMEIAYNSAIAVELLHNFTLVHDDLLDGAPLRRGKDSYHILHGMERTVHDGDLLHAHALTLVKHVPSLYLTLFVSREVGEGNAIELEDRIENIFDFSKEHVIEIMRLKTAVVFSGCVELGCLAANKAETISNHDFALKKAIIDAGIAFQIQDDFLDVVGNQETFGKKALWDLQESKRNLFLYYSLKTDKSEKTKQIYSKPVGEKTDQDIKFILNVFNEVSRKVVETRDFYLQRAIAKLDSLISSANSPEELELFEFLKDLSVFLCTREK